ncbi:MAG: hypothetical protein ABSG46_10865, partial [Candidatus Binataceae bacterium]
LTPKDGTVAIALGAHKEKFGQWPSTSDWAWYDDVAGEEVSVNGGPAAAPATDSAPSAIGLDGTKDLQRKLAEYRIWIRHLLS